MLEDDFEWIKEMERLEKIRDKKLKEIKEKHVDSELISFEDIDEMRKVLKMKSENDWQIVLSRHEKRNVRRHSEIYFVKMNAQNTDKKNLDEIFKAIILEPNINRLDYSERFILYMSWMGKYIDEKKFELESLKEEYNNAAQSLKELRMQEDRSILENAYIVAMTTTGSSRYHSVLKDIGPRIIIVEEAAEVFESHIVASLSKSCEHLILIGDHIQLRPNPAVYILAKDFDFDVSLFERLIKNDTKKVF